MKKYKKNGKSISRPFFDLKNFLRLEDELLDHTKRKEAALALGHLVKMVHGRDGDGAGGVVEAHLADDGDELQLEGVHGEGGRVVAGLVAVDGGLVDGGQGEGGV